MLFLLFFMYNVLVANPVDGCLGLGFCVSGGYSYTVSSTTYPHENTTNRNYHLFSMVDCCFVGSISARDTPTARENTVVNTPLCHRCEARCPADQISGSCYRHFSVIFTLGMELLSQTVARTISSNLPTKLFQCNFYFGLSCFFTPEYPSR